MAKRKSPITQFSNLQNSNIVFKLILRRLKTQKTQLDTLIQERNLLQDIIQLQQQRWVSELHFIKDQFFQMKRKMVIQDMERNIADAKSDLLIGFKEREAYIYKLESADCELGDFREWFTILSLKLSELQDMPKCAEEVKRLKRQNEELVIEKNSEISGLLAEKNSARNLYNEMKSRLKEQLLQKDASLESENKKIQIISSNMDELRSLCAEKDHAIEQLKSEMAKLEADSINKNEYIAKLSKELESLKSSRGNSVTPLLRHCSSRRGKNNAKDNKESHSLTHGKICRSSKGKAVEDITPRLFTSSFKVPKLKSKSHAV